MSNAYSYFTPRSFFIYGRNISRNKTYLLHIQIEINKKSFNILNVTTWIDEFSSTRVVILLLYSNVSTKMCLDST